MTEWHKEKPKALCSLVPSLNTGKCIPNGLLPLVKPLKAAALPECFPWKSGQGLYLNLVLFANDQ
ncbi:hypothetical protein ACWATR_13690 [Nostoc sp. UIC 10890]